ncbi:MAG: IclR family transcriptional regulator [Haloplanus sp.]
MTQSNGVKATRTSFRVVEALLEMDGAGVTELSDRLGLSKSSTHSHLATLCDLGYVVKQGDRYSVGVAFLNLGVRARRQYPVDAVVKPAVEQLADACGLVVGAAVEEGNRATYIRVVTGDDAATLDGEPLLEAGETVPLHATATGKALLAASGDDRVERLVASETLDRHTPNTTTEATRLHSQLQQVRERELAFDHEEYRSGQRGLATVIRDPEQDPVAAICIVGSAEQLSGKRFQQDLPGLLIRTRNKAQKRLHNRE